MDSSRRAVESYWRSRMIDSATSDEDKVTPVYKLEEICDLLRSSHVSIVKEVSEFILKRLDHKSPIVKQKALRLIKYAVGKSGVEFRREMQRHSAAVRLLFHYKGTLDPLKGDALNKAVRDTAHETVSAIFSEENRPAAAPTDDLSKRIQGFGNTNYEMPSSEDKKSFLSEVVGIGSASIKQGISSFTQGNLSKKTDNGSYRSPNLRRSLTVESDHSDSYEPVKLRNESLNSFGSSTNVAGGSWGQDSRTMTAENKNGDSSSSYSESKTLEERLLETIVTSGGVRLQPTRDSLQVFLAEATKLDGYSLSHALESKLQAPMWQVRMKALCVLEAILRRKDFEQFIIIASYFDVNIDVVIKCSESPQASLREKANKVLALLNGKPTNGSTDGSNRLAKVETSSVKMPDLIDTGDSDDFFVTDESSKASDQKVVDVPTPSGPLVDDLLGDGFGTSLSSSDHKKDDDPFADVSFHADESREHGDDIFSGMTVDKSGGDGHQIPINQNGTELFDIFGSNSELSQDQQKNKTEVDDLMAMMSINDNVSNMNQQVNSPGILPDNILSNSDNHQNQHVTGDSGNGMLGPQVAGVNVNPMFPTGAMPYNLPPGIMLNPAFLSQPINYGAMGNIFSQQQLLATMSNFQHLSNLNAQNATGSQVTGSNIGGYPSPLPDIFQPNYANQAPISLMNNTKKEDSRAFDFISDHLAAARDPKRVS